MTKESSVVPIRAAEPSSGDNRKTQDNNNTANHHVSQPKLKEDKVVKQNLTRLPMPINRVRDNANKQFTLAIQELFNHVDDALFELADRAESNLEQNGFFESMREIRIHRSNMEKGFLQNIDRQFTLLLTPSLTQERQPQSQLDDLDLVSKDELEEAVATDTLVNKSWSHNQYAIRALSARMNTVCSVEVNDDTNPLVPRALVDSFVGCAQSINIDIKAKLVLFKLFERHVVNKLVAILEQSNQLLENMGIALPKKSLRHTPKKKPLAQESFRPLSGMPGESPGELFQTLEQLLRPAPATSYQPLQEMPSNLVSSVLFSALSQLQEGQAQESPVLKDSIPTGGAQDIKPELLSAAVIESVVKQLSSASGDDADSVDQYSQDVIKLVDMLFSFILKDENLPDPVKLILIRLQIPYIKVAVADEDFFKTDGHPARRLLNEMATASIGWTGDIASMDKDPLLKKINYIVDRVLNEFDANLELFSELLTDFVSFVDKERRRVSLFEKRTIDAEDGKAKTEVGRQKVGEYIDKLSARYTVPPMIEKFIRGPWSNILFLIYMRQGVGSTEWNSNLSIVDNLFWSCQSIVDDQHQQKLNDLMPDLNQWLKQGLESISFNPAKQNKFLTALRELHLDLVNKYVEGNDPLEINNPAHVNNTESSAPVVIEPSGAQPLACDVDAPSVSVDVAKADIAKTETVEATVAVPAVAETKAVETKAVEASAIDASSSEVEPTIVEKESVVEATDAEGAQAQQQFLDLVDNFMVGLWFEKTEQESKYRCRLAAIIRAADKYIFVNRSGVKVAEESRESLAALLQAGAIKTLDDTMLFDRALESVISNLKSARPTTTL